MRAQLLKLSSLSYVVSLRLFALHCPLSLHALNLAHFSGLQTRYSLAETRSSQTQTHGLASLCRLGPRESCRDPRDILAGIKISIGLDVMPFSCNALSIYHQYHVAL
jgi:hypothetical protein